MKFKTEDGKELEFDEAEVTIALPKAKTPLEALKKYMDWSDKKAAERKELDAKAKQKADWAHHCLGVTLKLWDQYGQDTHIKELRHARKMLDDLLKPLEAEWPAGYFEEIEKSYEELDKK